jgi:UDP-N-acetylglucosamine 2-epimerase (non-hydrolysing)
MRAHVCITSQHKEMLQSVLPFFGITPDSDLDVMQAGQGLNDVLSRVLKRLPETFKTFAPHMTLVQGDTASCFAGALASFNQQVPVGHVEAGLRTYDLANPFPEEGFRQMVSRIATFHFAPTATSAAYLNREGIAKHVHVTGNTVIDALLYAKKYIAEHPEAARIPELPQPLQNGEGRFVLITGHRRENFGTPFRNMCMAIRDLARMYPNMSFVYPVHLNPRVRQAVHDILKDIPNVYLIPPQPYLPFVGLMRHCAWIITDSGGIQEEAPALGKPVLVTRRTTERPEAIEAGTSMLVGTETEAIVKASVTLMEDPGVYNSMSSTPNPYGDGTSAKQICDILEKSRVLSKE